MVSDERMERELAGTLDRTSSPHLGAEHHGKVRDSYLGAGIRTIVTTDRQSAFDRVVGTIPFKGQALNEIANFWFDATSDIVPNHLLEALGLGRLLDTVVCSADIGYKKPHPAAYRCALESCRRPRHSVPGAEQAGIPTILVRNHNSGAERVAQDFAGAARFVAAEPVEWPAPMTSAVRSWLCHVNEGQGGCYFRSRTAWPLSFRSSTITPRNAPDGKSKATTWSWPTQYS
ncbi:MAG TPA: phosphoribosylaminoimidazolesuccinocarboxamide synthase [Streptosporangiaceae bacterium]|nr:phosphoribosylaminoimidazolesuccinocarboxamide synthase [Streptosporangiaceae bacterium]